ncbi:hypothetical protein F4781DRAFT_26826 [Annulohypoxylon bovei var. microspora]|nr:hypothetical protein F4781DRAFT_26826 [Annulohypoxylon bovei var. microspora]
MEPSFPQFRLLPPEIRCMIWNFAITRRIVPVRPKWDSEARDDIDEEEEEDWEQFYMRVVYDGPVPLLSIALVNHEARHEIGMKPLLIDRETIRWSLGNLKVSDTVFDTLCESSRIPWFNPQRDVLKWREPHRCVGWWDYLWSRPVFLAACLSVRHISVGYKKAMRKQLEVLALAVLDPTRSPETLTITYEGYTTKHRLARHPSGPKAFLTDDWENLELLLFDHSVCFLPWYETFQDDVPVFIEGPHHKTRLDTRFSIYEVVSFPDHSDEVCFDRQSILDGVNISGLFDNDSENDFKVSLRPMLYTPITYPLVRGLYKHRYITIGRLR